MLTEAMLKLVIRCSIFEINAMIPLTSIFCTNSAISVKSLKTSEPEVYAALEQKYGDQMPEWLYYNKGL